MTNPHIRNLLIDLGGVLYEIDIASTLEKYQKLQQSGLPKVDFSQQSQHAWFSQLDRGETDIDTFAAGLKQAFHLTGSIETIKKIWAEILIGVLPGRTEAMGRLAKQYRTALLSNTNKFHFDLYKQECAPIFSQMDHLFLSFEMGLRKPDPAIYQQALDTMGWQAEETLFLDDSYSNIVAARELGIQTYWIEQHSDFEVMVTTYT